MNVLSRTFQRDSDFGWDGWPNENTRPAPEQINALAPDVATEADARDAASATYSGADTIGSDIGLLPNGLDLYASYVDNYGGWSSLVSRFGSSRAFLLSITIFGGQARCADVEPGAMVPSDLPHWLDSVGLKDNLSPSWVYTSSSNLAAANRYIGSRHVVRWSAHYGWGPHVCGPGTCGYPQADWTQWANAGPSGQNYDRSVGLWLPTAPTPTPTPDPPEEIDMATVISLPNADGRVEFHAINTNKRPTHRWVQQDGSWSNWTPVNASADIVELAGATHPNGHNEILAKDSNGHHHHYWQNGPNGTWSDCVPF